MLTGRLSATVMQRGAALIFSLIVLVTMLLAGAALMRSVDTSVVIAGNLAIKQSTIASGETGIETAIAWLEANDTRLQDSIAGEGYVAFRDNPEAGQSWDYFWTQVLSPANQIVTLPADSTDNRASYVIHRLCRVTGDPKSASTDCSSSPTVTASGNSKGAGVINPISSTQVYYRITARIDGPRNTVSYMQAIVAM